MEPIKQTRSFRINDDIWNLLKKEADRRGTTASALVTLAITEHISGTVQADGGIDAIAMIKLIGGLQEKTEKLANQLNDAKINITNAQGDN